VLGPSPYALAAPTNRLRAVAEAAGRAPVGGPREAVLATLLGARLAAAALPPRALASSLRAARAESGRAWLGTVALQPVPKAAASRLLESTAGSDLNAIANALAKVTDVTAPWLDRSARSALDSLVQALRGLPAAQA
jgi:hypothetical protein